MTARLVALLALLSLAACFHGQPGASGGTSNSIAAPIDGDYLTLVLSWSPTYCLSDAGKRDRQQCSSKRSYAFVVHGLWPQYEKGWPDYCAGEKAPWIEDDTLELAQTFMPSRKLVIHEWKKHGTCYSSQPEAYFDATETLFRSINIPRQHQNPKDWITTSPQDLKSAFLEANPQFPTQGISIHCGNARDRAQLKEIRLCYDRTGAPRNCGGNEKRQCRAKQLVMPPAKS